MRRRTFLTAMLLVAFGLATYAQGKSVTVKITDLDKVTTTISNASSSSSTGTSDFPVYQGSTQKEVKFEDLTWISVRHDLTPSDPNYIRLELTFKDGTSGIYEMVRYVRFTGKSEEGNFALMVKEINTIEIVHER